MGSSIQLQQRYQGTCVQVHLIQNIQSKRWRNPMKVMISIYLLIPVWVGSNSRTSEKIKFNIFQEKCLILPFPPNNRAPHISGIS